MCERILVSSTYNYNESTDKGLSDGHASDKILQRLSFMIKGDSAIIDNNELEMQIKIRNSNGIWQDGNGYIKGYDKTKFLHINLNAYKILPNHTFEIKILYVWPRTYSANSTEHFSFGTNTFLSTKPYELSIQVHGNEKCFSNALQQIRKVDDSRNFEEIITELNVYKGRNDENIVSTTLPALDSNCALYIELGK